MYLIFTNVNEYFEEINENKYLTLVSANESQEKLKKCKTLCSKIKNLIGTIPKNSDDYDEKNMKFKFDTDDELPLNKKVKIPIIAIVVRAFSQENNKYYQQDVLDKCLYQIWMEYLKKFVLKSLLL